MSLHNDLRQELEETRSAYHALVAELSPEDWTKPTSNPAWNVGDIMYHIAVVPRLQSLDLWMLRNLGHVLMPPAFLFHDLNKWYTRRGAKRHTLATIGQAYDDAHGQVLEKLNQIRDDEWHKGATYPGWDPLLAGHVTIETLFHYITLHFHAHAAEIRQAL